MSHPPDNQDDNPYRAPQVVDDHQDSWHRIPIAWRLVSYGVVTVAGAVSFYLCCGATCMAGASIMYGNSPAAPIGLVLMLASIPLSLVLALWTSRWLWKKMTGLP